MTTSELHVATKEGMRGVCVCVCVGGGGRGLLV